MEFSIDVSQRLLCLFFKKQQICSFQVNFACQNVQMSKCRGRCMGRVEGQGGGGLSKSCVLEQEAPTEL